ncbi:scramblase [Kipferlia bialata]|uniref:Phospholipid scramblase n=1 Tax=Kipferlia bialata TaxID=797122 RepID=A0A9K3CZG8_9EUKA|nr:scramblase [Kipferlia bialata]|eukprot:g8071.t1
MNTSLIDMEAPAPMGEAIAAYNVPGTAGGKPIEMLMAYPSLRIKQQKKAREIILGFDTQQTFRIQDMEGQDVLFAKESSDGCGRFWCQNQRKYTMALHMMDRTTLCEYDRPLRCQAPWCGKKLQELSGATIDGRPLGSLKQLHGWFKANLEIRDAQGRHVYTIVKEGLKTRYTYNIVEAGTDNIVGLIKKRWEGIVREAFTDKDTFCLTFPPEADAEMRAFLVGACILVDYIYFEN